MKLDFSPTIPLSEMTSLMLIGLDVCSLEGEQPDLYLIGCQLQLVENKEPSNCGSI